MTNSTGRFSAARAFALALSITWVSVGCSDNSSGSDAPSIQSGTLISLGDGMLQGELDGAIRRFLGIPFVAPPLGDLRWRPPQAVEPWDGVLDATMLASGCPQGSSLQGSPSENEDCLYLNVWSPGPAPDEALPVMLWFHGGGNQNGSTSDVIPFIGGLFYNGRGLSELADVVVVTAGYRLNVFGFLAHEALVAEDPDRPFSGNQGLQDQRAAMEWVQENIEAFGGDPSNVTIFGESAGSFDVCFHNVSPPSNGLFHRAVSQSGGCTTYITPAEKLEVVGASFADEVGCAETPDVLECLRSKPVAELLAAGDGRFGPIVDGDVIPDQPRALFDAGAFARVPYILGSNSDEGTLFAIGVPPVETDEEYRAKLESRYGDLADTIYDLYPPEDFDTVNDALIRVNGDSFLVCGTYDSAIRASDAGAPVYLYNFSRPVPVPGVEFLGATHGAEIAYVFGSASPESVSAEDIALSEAMIGYWGRFAYSGDPNGDGALIWPSFFSNMDQRINFDVDLSIVDGFRQAKCEFWRTTYDVAFEAGG